MGHNINGTFVSEKISRVRWRPAPFSNSQQFLTGSWDNISNNLVLWNIPDTNNDKESNPYKLNSCGFNGNVTQIKFLDHESFVASSSAGFASMYKIKGRNCGLGLTNEWRNLHTFPNKDRSPCTDLSTYNENIVTVGEDGCINFLHVDNKNPVRKIDNADSCSLHCVLFLKHDEVLTSNIRGQMKIWDLRSPNNCPRGTFMLSKEQQIAATSLQYHPSQHHIIVVGDEEGTLSVWDLRQHSIPINVLSAHVGAISELQFHADYPDQLFSSSNAGDIWHWTLKATRTVDVSNGMWITPHATNDHFEVFSLMPQLHKSINSFDLNKDKVLCGCDNEAVYLIKGIQL